MRCGEITNTEAIGKRSLILESAQKYVQKIEQYLFCLVDQRFVGENFDKDQIEDPAVRHRSLADGECARCCGSTQVVFRNQAGQVGSLNIQDF